MQNATQTSEKTVSPELTRAIEVLGKESLDKLIKAGAEETDYTIPRLGKRALAKLADTTVTAVNQWIQRGYVPAASALIIEVKDPRFNPAKLASSK